MTTLHRRSHTHPASGRALAYLEAAPTLAPAAGGTPLLLFLHGARDRGSDLDLLLRWAPPRLVAEAAETADLPYHFAAPQIPAGSTWPEYADELLGLIDHLTTQRANIDPARVLLAGFSLGAAGAWRIAAQHPRRFAGLVVVSGRLAVDADLDALATVPVWAFHGARDDKLPAAEYEPALAQLRERGAAPQHTLYLHGDHFIGERAFAEPDLLAWLLSLRAAPAAPALAGAAAG